MEAGVQQKLDLRESAIFNPALSAVLNQVFDPGGEQNPLELVSVDHSGAIVALSDGSLWRLQMFMWREAPKPARRAPKFGDPDQLTVSYKGRAA
jgi:hypothetical protein